MDKRQFLFAASASALVAAPLGSTFAAEGKAGSPALLTVTGAISKPNRGPFDPILDQMMAKQKLGFDKAHAFDFAAIAAMPAVTIKPTLEYDKKVHALSGPLLETVLKAAGAPDAGKVTMRAVDGYAPSSTLAELRKLRFIVATHLDGKPMPLGGLGPLWAVYEPDHVPEMAAKPLPDRFALCPWGVYHIDIQA